MGSPNFGVERLGYSMQRRMPFKYGMGSQPDKAAAIPTPVFPSLLRARRYLSAGRAGSHNRPATSSSLLARRGWNLLKAFISKMHLPPFSLSGSRQPVGKVGPSVICSQLASCCRAPGMEEADKWPCVLSPCQAQKFKRLRETEGNFLLSSSGILCI